MSRRAKTAAYWNKQVPTSLRHAMELCKEHAREVHNLSVERIAEQMGLADHWALYKWLQNGRMPVCLVRPYEATCGIDYVTRWMAASNNKLLVQVAVGKLHPPADMVALNSGFGEALQLLSDFYASNGKADPHATLQALSNHITACAYHHNNVRVAVQPELELA